MSLGTHKNENLETSKCKQICALLWYFFLEWKEITAGVREFSREGFGITSKCEEKIWRQNKRFLKKKKEKNCLVSP